MRKFGRAPVLAYCCASGAMLLGSIFLSFPASAASEKGDAVKIGKGTAQVVVDTDKKGKPISIGVSMTPGVLEGLPTELNKKTAEGSWEFALPMPKGSKTGYTEVMVDWNPHGHPPPHVYTVPHFDFHFYTMSPKEVEAIKFTGPKDAAAMVSDKKLVAPDYQVVPDTAVNMMGVHAIDTTAPEFHGKPFTSTFIYGYYKGKLIFLEPMITRAFLSSKPDVTLPVKTPAHYSAPAYYPAAYSVRYDASSKNFMVELQKLKAAK